MAIDSQPPAPNLGPRVERAEPRGYFLMLGNVKDLAALGAFRPAMERLRAGHNGRTLVHGQPVEPVIGRRTDACLTIAEHGTMTDLASLLANPEHAALLGQLQIHAPGTAWSATGVLPAPAPLPGPPSQRAYVVTRYRIVDPSRVSTYRELVTRLIAARGGRYLVRFDPAACLTGPSDDNVLSLLEFPSPELLQAGIRSDDFRDMMQLGVGIAYKGFWIVNSEPPGR